MLRCPQSTYRAEVALGVQHTCRPAMIDNHPTVKCALDERVLLNQRPQVCLNWEYHQSRVTPFSIIIRGHPYEYLVR